jgi:hypothetical protein
MIQKKGYTTNHMLATRPSPTAPKVILVEKFAMMKMDILILNLAAATTVNNPVQVHKFYLSLMVSIILIFKYQ